MTDDSLKSAFEKFGAVISGTIIMDRNSGRSKGFGFVEFEDDSAAQQAIAEMNGKEVEGRNLNVSVARPLEEGGRRNDRGFNRDRRQRY